MIKELNEVSKTIYDICVKAENEKWSFDSLIDHLQLNAKCHGVPFPTLMRVSPKWN